EWREALLAYAHKHLAPIVLVPESFDETPPFEPVEDMRHSSSGQPAQFGNLPSREHPRWCAQDEVNALGVGRIEPNSLRDRLVEEHRLCTHPSAEIPKLAEELRAIGFAQ